MKNKDTYTIEVDRHKPLDAVEEITRRTHDDIVNEFIVSLPKPVDGIIKVQRGLISSIANKFGYTPAGVLRLLERRGYYQLGVVPTNAELINININQNI